MPHASRVPPLVIPARAKSYATVIINTPEISPFPKRNPPCDKEGFFNCEEVRMPLESVVVVFVNVFLRDRRGLRQRHFRIAFRIFSIY